MSELFRQTPVELPATKPFWKTREVQLQAVGLVLCCALFLVQVVHFWPQTIDDSYITFRYARNFLNGFGLTFNPGEGPVEGFTNPTWMLLSALSIWLKIDPMWLTKIAGTLCSLALLVLVNRASAMLREKEDLWNCAAPLVLTGNYSFAFWAVQGMETPLNTLLIFSAWFSFATLAKTPNGKPWIFPLLVVLAFATRVDALWFLLGLPLLLAPKLATAKNWIKPIVVSCLWAAAGVVLLQIARVIYFGELLPNTLYAKTVTGAEDARGLAQLLIFYTQNGFVEPGAIPWGQLLGLNVGFVSLAAVALWGTWSVRIFVFIPLLLQGVFMILSNGDWMPCFRFFQVILPFLAVAASVGFSSLAELLKHRWKRLVYELFSVILLGGSALQNQRVEAVYIFSEEPLWFAREPNWFFPRQLDAQLHQGWICALGPISGELSQQLPDGSSIMMSDIGLPGWLMPQVSIVDVDGLTNRHLAFASSVRKPGETRASHEAQYVTSLFSGTAAPDYLLTFEQHLGNGPSVPGFVYPRPVATAKNTAAFSDYEKVWSGVKAQGDVWNHLYKKKSVESISPKQALSRLRTELEFSPALGTLLLPYTKLALLENESLHKDVVLMRALETNSANREIFYGLSYLAAQEGSAELALLLETFAHPVLQTRLWDESLLTAFKQSGLELEANRLEEKLNTSERTNPLP